MIFRIASLIKHLLAPNDIPEDEDVREGSASIKTTLQSGEISEENTSNRNVELLQECAEEVKQSILQSTSDAQMQALAAKLSYLTSADVGKYRTLSDYVSHIKEGQKDIYYLIEQSDTILESPFAQRFISAGFEVVYMTNPVLDRKVVAKLGGRYDNFRMISVRSEALEVPLLDQRAIAQRKRKQRQALADFLPLCKRLKVVYGNHFRKIVISNTCVQTSCSLVLCKNEPPNCDRADEDEEGEPYYPINMQSGRYRLELNADSDSLKLLCLEARILEKKLEYLDETVRVLFGPPTCDDEVYEEDSQP